MYHTVTVEKSNSVIAHTVNGKLICYIFILLIYRIFRAHTAIYTATVSAMLIMANWSQVIMYYACNMEHSQIMKNYLSFSIIIAISSVVVFILLSILQKLKFRQWLLTISFFIMSFGLAVLILLTNSDSNTSTLVILGKEIQPAIIMLFIMLYALTGYLSRMNTVIQKVLYLICFFMMAGSLIYKHELGIPFFCIISFVIMYVFLSSVFEAKMFIIPLSIMTAATTLMMIWKDKLGKDTLGKILIRTNANDQSSTAIKNLVSSGWFGTPSYDFYLPESSSDLALNNNVHYWGYAWLFIFMAVFFIYCIMQWIEFTRSSGTSMITNLRKLSFTAFSVITIYNILDNICDFPIIGVQLMCSGKSLSVAVLSGAFLGTAIFDENIKELIDSYIEVFNSRIINTFTDKENDDVSQTIS